jgi:hypothetical protein
LEIPVYKNVPRTYEDLRQFLENLDSLFSPGHLAEGIVFHHSDGRRAKIKRKDFARLEAASAANRAARPPAVVRP